MATIKLENFEKVDRQLGQLAIEIRGRALQSGLRTAGRVVVKRAKQLVPPPGYPGDKPDLKPLRDTIGVELRNYATVAVAVIGPKRPAGAHGHLVEESHRHFSRGRETGIFTEPHPFMGPAAEETKHQQQAAVIDGIIKAGQRATR